ncbi:MAG: ABC transporter ATP-binding protein [Alphaproteobacteria bacterium]|nr:MAG: ABC transporter ATP-binding protein [Alphaproteobacteria bacterium]
MSGQAILSVRDLAVGFGSGDTGVQAVRGVSFTLGSGEIMGIVGESGSGKSVTCRALLGLLPASARVTGEARFDGQDLLACSEAELRRIRGRQISMIFQNPASHLDPLMTVGRHVAEPLRFHFDERRPRAREAAIDLLRAVHIQEPERRIDSYPHELSGGMKQRALIASAIACRPRLLLADEPTTALDVTVQARILELLRELNRRHGLSIILVSHDLGVIAETCDRVLVMRDGMVVEQGSTRDIIASPVHAYTRLLIDSQPSALARKAHGSRARVPVAPAPILAVEELSVTFGRPGLFGRLGRGIVHAVDKVSFTVEAGESFGIVGESGSGKSTIARAIAQLVSPAAGAIRFKGESVHRLQRAGLTAFRRRVQMVFQNPFDSLNPRMSVVETIAEPLIRHRLMSRGRALARARELMEQVELPPALADRRPRQLSGGQCQRVGIARALALDPELLIADEITSALDVTIQAQILKLLQRLRDERNLTVLYISHDLAVVRLFCERVAVFRAGRLVEIGAVEEVLEKPRETYTRELIASAPRLEIVPVATAGSSAMSEGRSGRCPDGAA